ncbi:hypothetical protein FSP39_013681 [Pinctada imbricata]|uniref:Ion transport domain-containing protein n=1 Tax=Pinctada imbricata TaxID=66713 RepID=A0AA88XUM4_PINIB|nr:hypothetical protein FSP39_013681 [Pinctada imbricata]
MTGNRIKKINMRDEDDVTPLHYAARYDHLEVVKVLIENGANVNCIDDELLTPLHYAARYKRDRHKKGTPGSTEEPPANGRPLRSISTDLADPVVDYLVQSSANINQFDKYGLTPLHYACMRGNEMALRQLLTYPELNIEAVDKQGMTALHMAATHNHTEEAGYLIQAKAMLRVKDNEDLTPLHCACYEGNIEVVKLLFKEAAQRDGWVTIQNMVADRDIDQNTCLHLAVLNGHYDVMKLCVEKKADVNTPAIKYMHPLHLAAKAGDLNCVRLLVKHKARIDSLNEDMATPLHIAAANDHLDVVEYLVKKKAPLDKKDKDNYTPLLMAAYTGRAEIVNLLLKKGADRSALDKNDKSALYLAAEEDQTEALKVMLSYNEMKKMLEVGDRYDNHPLHIAAQEGYLGCVKILLENGASMESKNEEEQTPIHLAAKHGRTNVVKEFVKRKKNSVNEEDENSETPLHLAAINGHKKVVQVLLQFGADVAARNSLLWTPLDCAAEKGHIKIVRILLDADAPVDPMDKTSTTPLHLAAKNGHENVVTYLLEHHAEISKRDSDGNNCLDLAIDNNKVGVAMAILDSAKWEDAMRNDTIDVATEVAEQVFLKCMTANQKNPEHVDYKVVFNYEYLDDTYTDWSERGSSDSGSVSTYNDDFTLSKRAIAYTKDSTEFKKNHPLMIMVTSSRENLLAHPLVSALLRHKWSSFGRAFYYINFLIYAIFLVFLTGYMLTTMPPHKYYVSLGVSSSNVSETEVCKMASDSPQINQDLFAKIGKFVIIVLSVWNLIKEVMQMYQARLNYLAVENLTEWLTYISALLLVIDPYSCQRDSGYRFNWQWSLGAMSIFLGWVILVLFLQKFPRFGIYVVMFKDILNTFIQFFLVFVLFIVAFGFGFYSLLQNQDPFATPWESLIKTTVMMIGEYDYADVFYSDSDDFKDHHPVMTFLMFIVFMIVMSIIIMNLLVGLAVDDIKAVQEKAALRRMAMQVDLALDVEKVVPDFIRKRVVVKCEKIAPNRSTMNPFLRFKAAEAGDLTSESISKALDPDLDDIKRVIGTQDDMQKELVKVKTHIKEMRAQNSRVEGMLMALLNEQNIEFDAEDFLDNLEG